MTYDAIIVGSGHNGLASAIHLAKQGWKVGVFERNKVAGGAVQTREVTLPGFRHDLFAMNLGLFAGSPFLSMHGEALAKHGLAFAAAIPLWAASMAGKPSPAKNASLPPFRSRRLFSRRSR